MSLRCKIDNLKIKASGIFLFWVSGIGSKHFKYLGNSLSSESCKNSYHYEKLRKLQFFEILFLCKFFRPFRESNYSTCNQESKGIQPKSPSKGPGETRQMATDDWIRHGSHRVKKSYPESRVDFCEFALWRSLRILPWMVIGWIQDKNLNFLREDIGVVSQKSNS